MMLPAQARPGLAWVVALSFAATGGLVWAGQPGSSTAYQLVAVLGASCLGAAALICIARDPRLAQTPVTWVLLLALLLRLLAALAWPLLEDDHHRYLWDGLRTATTGDPYSLPPSAFFGRPELSAHWQDTLSGINNPEIPSLYGPVLQGLFALAYCIAPGRLGALQGLLLVVDMAVLLLLVRQRLPVRWLLAYAVHPLVLKEAMASAHPDGLLALCLLGALTLWQRRCAWGVGLMLGLAVATKVAALVTLPLWLVLAPVVVQPAVGADSNTRCKASLRGQLWWAAQVLACMLLALMLAYLPFWRAGGSELKGLMVFGETWRFNPLGWRLLQALMPDPAARWAAAALLVLGLLWLTWRRRLSLQPLQRAQLPVSLPPLDLALTLLLVLSPVVNAWYWLWALALSLLLRRRAVAAVAVVAPFAYANSSVLALAWGVAEPTAPGFSAPFSVFWPFALVQLSVLALAAWVDHRHREPEAQRHPGLCTLQR